MSQRGPSIFSLAHRSIVLGWLIARAVMLYLEATLASRGLLKTAPGAMIARQRRFARHFVGVATKFRGGLIKIGQIASLRIDVVAEEVTDELAQLQDRVEPHPFPEIREQVERELGASLESAFASFEREPIAAASLGQVHRARALDGRDLAVKVLYPGVARSVAVDVAMMKIALWGFNFLSVADLLEVHRQVTKTLHGEMDYIREGRAAEEVGRNLAEDPELAAHTRIPEIHWDLTAREVLAMEYIEGCKINDLDALADKGADRDELVLWASRAFLHMMFKDGFFHCDPHPGNLMVDSEGRIGIIDFGMNQRIEARILDAISRNVMATATRDSKLYASSLLDAGIIEARDVPAVIELAELSFDPKYFNLTPAEMMNLDFGEYFKRMRVSMKKLNGFKLPDGLVMWSRAISLLYALMVELAPGIRPLDVLGPYVAEFLQREQPSTLSGQPSTLSGQPSTVSGQPSTVSDQPSVINDRRSAVEPGQRLDVVGKRKEVEDL
jgi:predicted unusual protein kinase regulating ubiquinone biosynthesis (AarF/ABC1/UbiB family)